MGNHPIGGDGGKFPYTCKVKLELIKIHPVLNGKINISPKKDMYYELLMESHGNVR